MWKVAGLRHRAAPGVGHRVLDRHTNARCAGSAQFSARRMAHSRHLPGRGVAEVAADVANDEEAPLFVKVEVDPTAGDWRSAA